MIVKLMHFSDRVLKSSNTVSFYLVNINPRQSLYTNLLVFLVTIFRRSSMFCAMELEVSRCSTFLSSVCICIMIHISSSSAYCKTSCAVRRVWTLLWSYGISSTLVMNVSIFCLGSSMSESAVVVVVVVVSGSS